MRTLLPEDAPPTLKAALAAMYVVVALFVIDILVSAVFSPSGSVFLVDAVLAIGFLYLGQALGRHQNWARYVVGVVCIVLLLSSFTLFASGVTSLVKVVGAVQIVLFLAIIGCLVVRPTHPWFRPR